jgi:hypothetical protein
MSTRSSQSSTDWGYTSYSSFTAGRSSSSSQHKSSSSSKYSSSSARNTSYEESDEQDFQYGRQSKGYGGQGTISLGALKTPEISPWDSMGILGLSSKMYAATSEKKEGIFSSSSLIRRESVTSHAM